MSAVLRAGLLEGREVVLAGGAEGALAGRLSELGARVVTEPGESCDALVHDGRVAFGTGGREALGRAMARVWSEVQPVAAQAMIPAGRGGRIVLIAPAGDAGALVEAARAGLENLARTLSVEWARYGVTAVCVAGGVATSEEALAEVVAFVLSDAGGYLSGCRLSLA